MALPFWESFCYAYIMKEQISKNISLGDKDGASEELKRVQKIVKKFKVSIEDSNKNGIISRGSKFTMAEKRRQKGSKPDEWDKTNIEELIKTYNIAYPYPHIESIQRAVEEGLQIISKSTRKQRRDGLTITSNLPVPFVRALKAAYPFILTDKTQSKWFKENFPELFLINRSKNEQ